VAEGEPDELEILRAFVEAHAQRHPNTGDREPIMFIRTLGGSHIQHHAWDEPPVGVDETILEDMFLKGLITIDYREHSWNIAPTRDGRSAVEESDRIMSREPLADANPLVRAVAAQNDATNPLAWPAVRPVLAAIRFYWQQAGFPPDGIPLLGLGQALPDSQLPLFAATVRTLIESEYLDQTGQLSTSLRSDDGRISTLPGEVRLTKKAHSILDGWPGAAPEDLVENLLAVIATTAEQEPDPTRKRRLETLYETIREVGVSVTSDVIAKVLTGGLM
jgi:hypothetical protein